MPRRYESPISNVLSGRQRDGVTDLQTLENVRLNFSHG